MTARTVATAGADPADMVREASQRRAVLSAVRAAGYVAVYAAIVAPAVVWVLTVNAIGTRGGWRDTVTAARACWGVLR